MLAELREELIEGIQEELSIVAGDYPAAESGGAYEQAAEWLQALGICNLLLYASADRFYENLIRSGHTRRAFLQKCRDEPDPSNHRLAISRWESFFDAVAAEDLPLAREIVALSPAEWVRTGEYEDDFCYVRFLHQLVVGGSTADREVLRSTLERFAAVLDGEASWRWEVCGALYARDAARFEESFQALLASREAEMSALRSTPRAADPGFVPRSTVFVEGLALLRIAEAMGIPAQREYPMCPSLARLPRTAPPPIDVYPEIRREVAELQGRG